MKDSRSLAAFCLLLALPVATIAQDVNATHRSGLVIEIKNPENAAPSFLPVAPVNTKRSAMWTPRFKRVPGFSPEPGTQPVRAVHFSSSAEGEAARVNVSVSVGARYFEKELQVQSFLLREGDKVLVKQLVDFGVEPFEITVVRPPRVDPPIPSVLSKAGSLEIIGLEPVYTTIPLYKLTLRNLSSKNIAALRIDVVEGSRLRLSSSPRGKEGVPLIPAGEILETNVPGAKDTAVGPLGYEPASPNFQTIVVTTLVFDDGSYEGDQAPALRINAMIDGERIQLKRAIGILKQTFEAPQLPSPDWIASLIKSVSSLSDETPVGAAENQGEGLANVGDSKQRASLEETKRFALHHVKKTLLDEINAFHKSSQRAPDETEFRTWLTALLDRYTQWLSRLQ